jgi:hypothetical protein
MVRTYSSFLLLIFFLILVSIPKFLQTQSTVNKLRIARIMRFTYILSTLISVSASLAAPGPIIVVPAPPGGIKQGGDCPNTGAPGNFLMCSEPGWKNCEYQLYTSACFKAPGVIKSFGPDVGTNCTTYTTDNCSGDPIYYCEQPAGTGYWGCSSVTSTIRCPGYSDFQDSKTIKSIKCVKTQ